MLEVLDQPGPGKENSKIRYILNEMRRRGTKSDVYHGRALKTAGGLTKNDLTLNKVGRVVSKKQSEAGKRRGLEKLKKYQFKKKQDDSSE